jgi:quinol monooxygenase YgiN
MCDAGTRSLESVQTSLKKASMILKPFLGASPLAAMAAGAVAVAEDAQSSYVQMAEIDIDLAQWEAYKAAAETAVRVEPGVQTLCVVADKDRPTHITVFEIYANAEAYRAHLETPHFTKYKVVTEKIAQSPKLIKAVPIALATKAK